MAQKQVCIAFRIWLQNASKKINAPAFTSQGVTVYQIYVYMPLFHPVIGLLTPLLKLQTGSSLSLVTKRYNHIDDSSNNSCLYAI